MTPITQEYVMEKLAWRKAIANALQPQVLPDPKPEVQQPMNLQSFKGFPQTMKKKEPQWASAARDNIENAKTTMPSTVERGGGTWSGRGPR